MKLLIMGGTVYLSKAIAVAAIERGWEVTVAARGVSGEPPAGVEFVHIDRSTAIGMDPLRGRTFDAVIDVARVPAHVGIALDALADTVAHWTFVSTCSVYADNVTPGQTATAQRLAPTAPDSTDPDVGLYGSSKVACEDLVTETVGDRAFIVRPGLVVGPGDVGDRFGYWPHRIADGGEILAPGDPSDLVQYIDVGDLAEWILNATVAGTVGTFDAVRPAMTRQRFLTEIADALSVEPTFTWVPHEFLTEQGVNAWAGEDSLGLWLPLPEYAGFFSRDILASIEAGLLIRPLAETVHQWRAAVNDPPVLKSGITRDRELQLLADWRRHIDA